VKSEQLVLFDEDVWRRLQVRIPWEGRSPRVLTRGHEFSIFEAHAGGVMRDMFPEGQLALWLDEEQEGVRRVSPSARLLLEPRGDV